jgi:hypothetical protein
MPVMKISWISSPLALAFAQQFLPEQTWVPFFNIISFVIGTYINASTKKKRLAALRRKHFGSSSGTGRPEDYPGSSGRPGVGPGGMGGPEMSSGGIGGSNPPY